MAGVRERVAGGGFSNQEGVAVGNSLSRYTFRANLDQKVNNWLKIGFNSGVTRQSNYGLLTGSNNLSGNTFGAMRMFPNVAVYDPNDPTGYNIDDANARTLGRGANTIEIANGIPNIRFVIDNDRRESFTRRLLGNVFADVNLAGSAPRRWVFRQWPDISGIFSVYPLELAKYSELQQQVW